MRITSRLVSMVMVAVLHFGCGDDGAPAPDSGTTPHDGGTAQDGALPNGDLPSGNQGIASRYVGDEGIAGDSDVLFFDDFEGYGSGAELGQNWNAGVYHNAEIETASEHVFAGAQALRFTSPQQAEELSNGVARTVSPELDALFLRFYSKFDPSFDVVGSSHNGGGISSHYFVNGNATPGVPADGTNKFLVEYECWRGEPGDPNPGWLNTYIYHPEQRDIWGDHFFPNGDVMPNTSLPGNFGPEFVARPNVVPELDRWYCYELMVQANTPGSRDGRVAFWLDGELKADFQNLRLRDVPTLTVDRFGLSLHIGSNLTAETRKWYDNVVAARSYIGPRIAP
ncbi:MAG: hypothetical protein ABI333_02120 [bacterium]